MKLAVKTVKDYGKIILMIGAQWAALAGYHYGLDKKFTLPVLVLLGLGVPLLLSVGFQIWEHSSAHQNCN